MGSRWLWRGGSLRRAVSATLLSLVGASGFIGLGATPAAAAPLPSIDATPGQPTLATRLAWAFSHANPGVCELVDPAGTMIVAQEGCTSPTAFDVSGDVAGNYTFTVYAIDKISKIKPLTPKASSVVLVAPLAPTITSSPTTPFNDPTPRWAFTVSSGATASCELDHPDGTAIQTDGNCTSPFTAADLTASSTGGDPGPYIFKVNQTVSGATSANATSVYDFETATPPTPTVTADSAIGFGAHPTFTVTGLVPGDTTQCAVTPATGAAVQSCGATTKLDLSGAPDDTYTLHVTQTFAGNVSDEGTATYALDTHTPNTPTIAAADPFGTNPLEPFSFGNVDSDASLECSVAGPSTVGFSCDSSTVLDLTGKAAGTYIVTVDAIDAAGKASATASASYEYEPTAPPAPTVTAARSAGSGRSPHFTVSDSEDVTLSYACTVLASAGGDASAVPAPDCTTSPVTLDLSNAPDGTYTLSVTATDESNQTSPAGSDSYTLDTSTPKPTASLSSPASSPSGVKIPTFAMSDTELADGPDSFSCEWDAPDGSVISSGPCGSGDGFPTAGHGDGTYTLNVTATDAVGNTAAADPVTYALETGPPPTPVVAVVGSRFGSSPKATFHVSDPENVTLTYACSLSGSLPSNDISACGATTKINLGSAADGVYTLSVTATDGLGHTSLPGTATYTLDTAAQTPGVALAAPLISPSNNTSPTFTITDNEIADGPDVFTCTWSGPGVVLPTPAPCASGDAFPATTDGDYTLSVTSTDQAGNTSTTAGTATYTLDTTPPPAPSVSLVVPAATPGNVTSPQFTVSDSDTSPGLTYTCSVTGATTVPAARINCGATTTVDLSGPGRDGAYTLAVSAVDAAGNQSLTAGTATYTLDATAPATPTVTLTTPLASPGNLTSPQFAVANPGDTSPGGLTYSCTVAGPTTVPASAITCGTTTTVDLSGPGRDGAYKLVVTAKDKAGNTSAVDGSATYKLDTTKPAAPTVTLTLPASSPGNVTTPLFSVANPGDTSPGGLTYACSVTGATGVPPAAINCGSTTSVDLSGPGRDGDYQLIVTATDAAGNVSATNGTASYTLDTANPATPTVVLTSPAASPGTSTAPQFTVTNPGDVSPGGLTYSCAVSGATSVPAAAITCGPTTTVDLSGPGRDGLYTLSVIATDQAGNLSTAGTATYTLDATPPAAPTVSLLVPSKSPNTVTSPQFSVANPGDTSPGGIAYSCTATYRLTQGGPVSPVPAADIACGATTTLTLGAIGDARYTLSVLATDAAGNVSATPGTINYGLDTTAPAAPTVTLTSPASSPGNATSPQFSVSNPGDTSPGGPLSYSCTATVTAGGTTVPLPAADIACGTTTTLDLLTTGDGDYTLSVVATDKAGNTSPLAGTATYTLDTSLPAAPSVTLTTPASSPGNVTSPQFAVTDSDTSPGGVTFACSVTGRTQVPASAITCGPTTTVDLSGAGRDGSYTLSVTATDKSGNVSSSAGTASYTLDTTVPGTPTVSLTTPASSPGNVTAPRFSLSNPGDVSPGGLTYTCSVVGATPVPGSAITCGATTTVDLSGAGRDGAYTLSVTATDKAGNSSVSAGTASYTLDTTAPPAPIVVTPGASTKLPVFGISDADPSATLTCQLLSPKGRTVFALAACPANGTFDTTAFADGDYSLTVIATDPAGNQTPVTVIWTRDTIAPPPPSATAPASPSNDRTPTFSISDSEAGATLTCDLTGPNSGSLTVFSGPCPADGTIPIAGSDGSYVLTVTASDAAGNVQATTATASYMLDTTRPNSPIVTRTVPAASPGNVTSPKFTVSDPDSSPGGLTYSCSVAGPTAVPASAITCGSTTTVDLSGAGRDGLYTLSVIATDAAQNSSLFAGSATYVLDTTAPPTPTPLLSQPLTSPGHLVAPVFLITDSEVSPGLTFNCSVTGATTVPASAIRCGNVTTVDLSGAGRDGLYTLSVTATDAAGNTSASAGTASYSLDTVAPAAPIVDLASATRSSSKLPVWTWQFGLNDVNTQFDTASCDVTGPRGWSSTTANCGHHFRTLLGGGDGAYSLTVTLTDEAGNSASSRSPVYTLDSTAPAGAQVVLKHPSSLAGLDRHPEWKVTGPPGSTFKCTLLRGDHGGMPIVPEADCPDPARFSLVGEADGLYTLKVIAVDSVGNRSFPAWGRYVLIPSAPQVRPPTSHSTPAVWTVEGSPGNTFVCSLFRGGTLVAGPHACGNHPSYGMSNRPAGTYTLFAVQIGAAGAQSQAGSASWFWPGVQAANPPPNITPPNNNGPPPPPGNGGHKPPPPPPNPLSSITKAVQHQLAHAGGPATTIVPTLHPPLPTNHITTEVTKAVQGVVHAVGAAGGGTGFPLLLLGLVLAFLIAQNRIDRRDPKLALASVAADDMVEFQLPPSRRDGP